MSRLRRCSLWLRALALLSLVRARRALTPPSAGGLYPPADLTMILSRVDLAALIGRTVTLTRAGANWKGLCPFHAERTPSFMVNPEKRIFHCFGCGVGGDAFTFLMRAKALTFSDAVRALAQETSTLLGSSDAV